MQGYNAQAAVTERQIVLAAEVTNSSTDFSQLDPMVTATLDELERVGIDDLPEAVAADAGYWNEQHMDEVVANKHIPVLVARQGHPRYPQALVVLGARLMDAHRAGLRARPPAVIENANRRLSPCSATPCTTAASTASTGEAGSRCASSGDY